MAAQLESVLLRRPCEHWVERLTALGIPCSPVNSMDAAFALAQRLGLDPVRWLPAGDGRQVPTVANPITMSRTPALHRLPPPVLGAHSDEVLGGLRPEPG